jgi:hypothetical protein
MAPDGVQLTNDGQLNELHDIMIKFIFAATNLKKVPQTRYVRGNTAILKYNWIQTNNHKLTIYY